MNFEAGKEPDPLPDALRCNDDRAGHQPRRLSAGRKSLAIEIDYTLEANYQYVSDSKIRIMVRERKQQA